jgi:ribonuclease-3
VGAIYLDKGYDACMRFMEKRILAQLINIDKVAYKEVNFKSKLLEWSQKNRVKLEFRAQEQKGNDNNSPVFTTQVFLEGLEGCSGTGYSKKESQQNASKETLQRLRREPQFIDSIFAAKADRTKMEEEPVMAAPDIDKIKEENENFIETRGEQPQTKDKKSKSVESVAVPQQQTELDKLTLDDITATPREKTREEIIAEAEAAAFEEA